MSEDGPPLSVVYEDDALLVLDKPAGVLVHPVLRGQTGTLKDAVLARYAARGEAGAFHPVHRLDRDTSGLVVVARTPHAHRSLAGQLRVGLLRRTYLAVVRGEPREDEGTVDAPVGRDPAEPRRRMVRADGAEARTRWRVVERLGGAALLEVELETGRTHQVRVHLASVGHPLVGDRVYGGAGRERMGRQALHAARVSLLHPSEGAIVSFAAALPGDVEALLRELRGG